MIIEKRNILIIYLLGFITFGIYFIVWFNLTRKEINSLGAKIPSIWLIFVPFANLYWLYKYFEGFAIFVKGDGRTWLWFLLDLFIGIATPAIVQSELNKLADDTLA